MDWRGTEIFDDIKCTVAHDTLLAYPYFNKLFIIHTEASDYQLGAVISQYGKPIDLYSKKLTKTKTPYMATENGFLSIVKTLKEFRTKFYQVNSWRYSQTIKI